jgi:hypothetical protein
LSEPHRFTAPAPPDDVAPYRTAPSLASLTLLFTFFNFKFEFTKFIKKFVFYVHFWLGKDPNQDRDKMLDPDPVQINPDPQPCTLFF